MDFAVQPMWNRVQIKILFVCLGNICRSPALEASFKKIVKDHDLSDRFFIDSAAINTSFLGCEADLRMREAAKKRGVEVQTVAKLFEEDFFQKFDLIFVATTEILDYLKDLAKNTSERKKVHLATEFSGKYLHLDIPDPYYQKEHAFDLVMDISEDACQGIFEWINKKYYPKSN